LGILETFPGIDMDCFSLMVAVGAIVLSIIALVKSAGKGGFFEVVERLRKELEDTRRRLLVAERQLQVLMKAQAASTATEERPAEPPSPVPPPPVLASSAPRSS
jgi:hypothetical protein